MTTATNITIPCTASNLTALMQQWKNSIADAPVMPTMAARPMSASEIAAFLNAASHDPDKVSGLLLSCTLLSGIPPIDLAAAEWDLYDATAGKIEVCDEEAGYYTSYQLSLPALDMLKAANLQHHDVPRVFHYNGEPVNGDDLAEAFDRITLNAGIMDLSVPDLLMAYDYVVLFAALFEVPLTLPTGLHAGMRDDPEEGLFYVGDLTDEIDSISDF